MNWADVIRLLRGIALTSIGEDGFMLLDFSGGRGRFIVEIWYVMARENRRSVWVKSTVELWDDMPANRVVSDHPSLKRQTQIIYSFVHHVIPSRPGRDRMTHPPSGLCDFVWNPNLHPETKGLALDSRTLD